VLRISFANLLCHLSKILEIFKTISTIKNQNPRKLLKTPGYFSQNPRFLSLGSERPIQKPHQQVMNRKTLLEHKQQTWKKKSQGNHE
jgi:hypothetical protein